MLRPQISIAASLAGLLFLSACASGGSATIPAPGPGASLPVTVVPPPAPPAASAFSVARPAPPSQGSAPKQTATSGGPAFSGPYPSGAIFPLNVTTLEYTGSGPTPVTNNQNATAILKSSSAKSSELQLVIPSVNVDATITIGGDLAGFPTTPTLNFNTLAAAGEVLMDGTFIWKADGLLLVDGLNYASFGVWDQRVGAQFSQHGSMTAFAFGLETPEGAMPMAGTAEYKGIGTVHGKVFWFPNGSDDFMDVRDFDLAGDATLTANFVAGRVAGVLTPRVLDLDFSWKTEWNDVSVSADIASGSNRFSGTTASIASPNVPLALSNSATGNIDGAFFGPGAENLGAVWTLSDGTKSAIGVIGATRQ